MKRKGIVGYLMTLSVETKVKKKKEKGNQGREFSSVLIGTSICTTTRVGGETNIVLGEEFRQCHEVVVVP
jgi:hypothetical protein